MNDREVVGIPVGGATADAAGPHHQAVGTLGNRETAVRGEALARDQASADRSAAEPGPLSHGSRPPCLCGGGGEAVGGPSRANRSATPANSLGDTPLATSCDQPSPGHPIAGAASAPAPIFHVISEPDHSAPLPSPAAVESHLEVGVRGRARVTGAGLPETSAVTAEVRQPGRVLAFAAAAAVVVGSGFLLRALTLADPVPPPLPPAWAGRAVGAVGHRAAPMGFARPTRVSIARVGIHADVLSVGLGRDGAVGVPPAGKPLAAAWYDRGPAPGQAGPAVITGHVDSRFAPGNRAAFYELGAVRPGDTVEVARADRRVAVFRVDSVALVAKTGFPTRDVYGPTGYAALRLITCGGHYDRRTGYADNVIVYAHLVGSR